MSKPFDNLNAVFDIEAADKETKLMKKEIKKVDISTDVDEDYTYVRSHLTSLVMKGQEILDGIMDVAEQTSSPRAYEVAVNGVKNVAEVVEKLTDLHKKVSDMRTEYLPGTNVTGNVFIAASTSDLMQMIKKERKEIKLAEVIDENK